MNVTTAPSSVPCVDIASAALIMSTTYIQAMATRYMSTEGFSALKIALDARQQNVKIITTGGAHGEQG